MRLRLLDFTVVNEDFRNDLTYFVHVLQESKCLNKQAYV